MPERAEFTILILLFGDYPDLARRCLRSIASRLPSPHVEEVRLGLNAVSHATRTVAGDFLDRLPVPDRVYASEHNRLKYPVMRDMLYDPPTSSPFVMWFDDDSCIRPDAPPDFFARAAAAAADADVMGEARWYTNLRGDQPAWIRDQPWYGGKPVEADHQVRFATGGWLCARPEVLARFGWPVPDLIHRGGDVMLGELCRQQGLRLKAWSEGVAINADIALENGKCPRRGFDSPPVGFEYCRGRP